MSLFETQMELSNVTEAAVGVFEVYVPDPHIVAQKWVDRAIEDDDKVALVFWTSVLLKLNT